MIAIAKPKYLLLVVLLMGLSACKSSPPLDAPSQSVSGSSSSTTTTFSPASATSETPTEGVEEVVVSTAETQMVTTEAVSHYTVESGDFNLYPRETNGWDVNGWSIITPSEDSRLIYVSSDVGDDETAEFYMPRDIADLRNPGLIKPFKTINAGLEHARRGFPDWILLRQGDEWQVQERTELTGGRSVDERFVLTSYGETGDRPVISNSEGKEILRIWTNQNYIAITGISFYGIERDPDGAQFVGWGNVPELAGILIYGAEGTKMGSILMEDNNFNFLSKAINSSGEAEHVDIVVRRNIIRNSYNELGHSQGMFAINTSAFLEENIFDHNGWYKQQKEESGREKTEGQATIYNHNTYFPKSQNSIFRDNIFLRPSSIHNKWTANPSGDVDAIVSRNLTMKDNLYVGGEIGISAGGNDDYDTGARWENIQIVDNIMLAIGRDQPTNRNLGWYIDSIDWQGGRICGNYLLNNDNVAVQNINAIKVNGHSSDITVSKNLIYGLKMLERSTNNGAITVDDDPKSNISITDNNIQLSGGKMLPVIVDETVAGRFQNNRYYTGSDVEQWFRVAGVDYSYDDWLTLAGDTGSSNEQQTFDAPERSFETYLTSIGLSPNINAFVEAATNLPPRTWDERFSAAKINTYIREGYGNTTCN